MDIDCTSAPEIQKILRRACDRQLAATIVMNTQKEALRFASRCLSLTARGLLLELPTGVSSPTFCDSAPDEEFTVLVEDEASQWAFRTRVRRTVEFRLDSEPPIDALELQTPTVLEPRQA